MPTYQYRCKDCGHDFEIVQSFSDDSLTMCGQCKGSLRKVFGNVGISFKGGGFYKNDNKSGSPWKPDSSSSSGTAGSSSGSSSDAGSGSDSKSSSDSASSSSSTASSSASSSDSGSSGHSHGHSHGPGTHTH